MHGMNKEFGFTSRTWNLQLLRTCILIETAKAVNDREYEQIKQKLRIKALEGLTYINS